MEFLEFEEQNMVIAKDQKEYTPIPAWYGSGLMCARLGLSPDEVRGIVKNKFVYLSVLHFDGPVQPMDLIGEKPEFPVSLDIPLECNTVVRKGTLATFKFKFSKEDIKAVRDNHELWMVVSVRDTSLLPIYPALRWTIEL